MGPTSPERLEPAWRPGPFIPGRDWTRASRRVGLQQFCRAQISLPAQSEPLAGRDICCLTFLIYTSPPSHTNTQLCSPPFQTSLSQCISGGRGRTRYTERERERGREQQRDMFNRVWATLCVRAAAVGLTADRSSSHHLSFGFRVTERRRWPKKQGCSLFHPAIKHYAAPQLLFGLLASLCGAVAAPLTRHPFSSNRVKPTQTQLRRCPNGSDSPYLPVV